MCISTVNRRKKGHYCPKRKLRLSGWPLRLQKIIWASRCSSCTANVSTKMTAYRCTLGASVRCMTHVLPILEDITGRTARLADKGELCSKSMRKAAVTFGPWLRKCEVNVPPPVRSSSGLNTPCTRDKVVGFNTWYESNGVGNMVQFYRSRSCYSGVVIFE